MIRKWTKIVLTAVLVAGILSTPMPVSAQTWDPGLGWDFQCHSHTHDRLSTLKDYQIRWEMDHVNAAFEAHGLPTPKHHAYPYGDMDDRVKAILAEYRKSGRVVSGNMETYPIADWYELKAAQLNRTTEWAEAKRWVDDCIANNALLIIFTHDVKEKPELYGCTPENLTRLVDYVVEKKNAGLLKVMTIAEAYDYWNTTTEGKATCVFTFDDCWATDYTTVYSIFKERGLKGTSYIITGRVGGGLDRLTWEQIEKMRAGTPQFTPQFTILYVILGAYVLTIIVLVLVFRRKL